MRKSHAAEPCSARPKRRNSEGTKGNAWQWHSTASNPPGIPKPLTASNASMKVSPGNYMRELCLMFMADNWLWMALPLALCTVLAVWVDVRFAIVAMMVLFIVLPMVLALLYFYYGLSPEARWSIMDKDMTVDSDGITLHFDDQRMKTHVIPRDNVRHIIEKDDVWLLMLHGRRYTCLMLPASVIDPDVAQRLRQLVAQTH